MHRIVSSVLPLMLVLFACARSPRVPTEIVQAKETKLAEAAGDGRNVGVKVNTSCGPDGPLCVGKLRPKLNELLEAKGKLWGQAYQFAGHVMIHQAGETLYERGFGYADRVKKQVNDAETNFRIGSVTKQFTAAAILRLQEQGKLSVTDTITKHLPHYPKQSASQITIHHLLTHTSGIFNYTQDPELMKSRDVGRTPEELLATFSSRPLEFAPGSKFRYSNSGYAVLGAMIEKVSGGSLGEYLQQEFFGPAGLTRTVFGDAEELSNRALGYAVSPNERVIEAKAIDMSIPFAAGAIRSTANDLVRWDLALREGTVLQPASLQAFYRSEMEDYAYGWLVKKQEGQRVLRHSGGIDGFRTSYIRVPDHELVIVVWTNLPNLDPGEIGTAAMELLFGNEIEVDHELPLIDLPKIEIPRIVGYYRLRDESRDALVKDKASPVFIQTINLLKIIEEDGAVVVKFIDDDLFRLYSRDTGPGDYFAKQNFARFDFDLNSDGAHAEHMLFRLAGTPIKMEFRRDDVQGEQLWSEESRRMAKSE